MMKKLLLTLALLLSLAINAQSPVANFTISSTLSGNDVSVTFNNLSTNNPTEYTWSFTGGSIATSTAINPIVNYAAAGTFDVSLTVTNAAGTSTASTKITISEPLMVNLSTGKNTDGTLMTAGTPDTDWTQIKSDNTTSTPVVRNPFSAWSYAQITTGVKESSWITGGNFATDYYVYKSKSFTVPAGVNAELSLRSLSFVRGWTYLVKENGDGTTTETEITRTQYLVNRFAGWLNSHNPLVDKLAVPEGNYHIKVKIYTNNNSVTEAIDVNGFLEVKKTATLTPLAQFSTANLVVCRNVATPFNSTTSGTPSSYEWTFRDGPSTYTSTLNNPSITFTRNGGKNVRLITNFAGGLSSTLSISPYVNVVSNNCRGAAVQNVAMTPNPASNNVHFDAKVEKVEIFNMSGLMVDSKIINAKQYSVSHLLNGNYIIKIYLESGEIFSKNLIKN